MVELRHNFNLLEPQPFQNVLLFKVVVHSLEPGETPSYSASHQAQKYVQRS